MSVMRKFLTRAAIAAAPIALAFATPAAAQSLPLNPGAFWDVSFIEVPDEGVAPYADFLATSWRKQQEFFKSKGWIKDYHILQNSYKRPGEADMFLVTVYDKVPDAAEQMRQGKEYDAAMKTDVRKSLTESAGRATIRKVMGSAQYQELLFAK